MNLREPKKRGGGDGGRAPGAVGAPGLSLWEALAP